MSSRSSTIASHLPPLKPAFESDGTKNESTEVQAVIEKLGLRPHIEGGYFVETDRDDWRVPNPFLLQGYTKSPSDILVDSRSASTSIHYLLTAGSPLGAFHRNRARTVHTLHRGRGRYVIIHADQVARPEYPAGYGAEDGVPESQRWTGKARVETFVVGQDVLKGERIQWIVEGGKYKCSFLLPDEETGDSSQGLLISETVVPGFEYSDHDFMKLERMQALVTEDQAEEMNWMLRKI